MGTQGDRGAVIDKVEGGVAVELIIRARRVARAKVFSEIEVLGKWKCEA